MNSGPIAAAGKELLAAIAALAGCIALLGVSLPASGQAVPSSSSSPSPSASPLQQGMDDETPLMFDIPAQSLQAALERFMTVTGYSGVYDSAITAGLQSTEIKGLMVPQAALRQLIAATGLSVRYAAEHTFAILRSAVEPVPVAAAAEAEAERAGSNGDDAAKTAYFGQLQAHIKNVFCRYPSTAPGTYRVALSLWIAADGAVQQVRLLDSSGSPQRDARISASLGRLHLPAPPQQAGIQQPLTLVFLQKPQGAADDCAGKD
jgi:hypothetical protein